MNILVIDGQGGRLGRRLLESIRKTCPEALITAVGTRVLKGSAAILEDAMNHIRELVEKHA